MKKNGKEDMKDWSVLSTVTKFDEGLVVKQTNSRAVRRRCNMALPAANSLFIESLIEQLCKLIENDPKQQKRAYDLICSRLADMSLIDNTYSIEEFASVRHHYRQAFMSLVQANRISYLLPNPRLMMNESRYKSDYDEMSFIAEGGFGKVFKAKHKLDNVTYAVKKIILKPKHVKRFYTSFEEVKTLAKLNHPNIVQYKSAWLEPHVIHVAVLPAPPVPDPQQISSDGIVFEQSKSKQRTSEESSSSNSVDDNEDKLAVCEYKSYHVGPTYSEVGAVLYVSMQLCDASLGQWLDVRNGNKDVVNVNACIAVLLQTTAGLEYIHSQHIVHLDIKPSNIFVSHDLKSVQVGDFGLSCCLNGHSNNATECAVVKGKGGTELYMAPEQLQGQCHPTSDMFSLGLVLLELFTPFTTQMERIEVLKKARQGHLPAQLPEHIVPIAEQLLHVNTCERPSATLLIHQLERLLSPRLSVSKTRLFTLTDDETDETNSVITCSCSCDNETELKLKDKIIKTQEEEIERLKKLLLDRDTEITQLRTKPMHPHGDS